MHLEQLGWSPSLADALEQLRTQQPQRDLVPGRIVRQDRGLLRVDLGERSVLAKTGGRMEHRAATQEDLPVIGDWVAVGDSQSPGHARIQAVLPRTSALTRRAAGENTSESQVIAANVDTVFVFAALDSELNLRRLERMLALARASGAHPVVLLNKSDLSADPAAAAKRAQELSGGADVVVLSAKLGEGLDLVHAHLPPARTAVLLGPSGVGKSTLANKLLGEARLAVTAVREADRKGRHTTTHRELFALENGALLIDGPGMREFGVTDAEGGAAVFDDVEAVAAGCRFADCQHLNEPGCAVRAAVEAGELDARRVESLQKLRTEAARRSYEPAARRTARSTSQARKNPGKKR